ncbi:MAG: hypothetical protein QNJ38_06770 [Prochloraceae cyanobacterium]|nr:hypothetical protein [Prochloraceae cyanobacterium]
MNEVDRLLSQFKTEYQNKQQTNDKNSLDPKKSKSVEAKKVNSATDNALEQLKSQYQQPADRTKSEQSTKDVFANIKSQFDRKASSSARSSSLHSKKSVEAKEANSATDNALEQLKSQYQQPADNAKSDRGTKDVFANIKSQFDRKASSSARSSSLHSKKSKVRDNLIEQMRSDYRTKQKQQRKNHNLHNLEEIQQQELNRQRQRKALTRQARSWLDNLDPRSDEGLWFEEFAYTYESKLEAAIDYLAALQESGLKD